MEIDQ